MRFGAAIAAMLAAVASVSACTAPVASPVRVAAPAPALSGSAASTVAALDALPVKGRAPKTGYARDQFGAAWSDKAAGVAGAGNGCRTRDDILRRDLRNVTMRDRCVVASGTLDDPYTGRTVHYVAGRFSSSRVQIDHVVALGDAWVKGAQQATVAERLALANDPDNLVAVDGPTNGAKGDRDAATWLPPNKAARCGYVSRQVLVKSRYHLWVTAAEKEAIRGVLNTCN